METLDMDVQRRQLLASQAHDNVLRERQLLGAWHQAVDPIKPRREQQAHRKG